MKGGTGKKKGGRAREVMMAENEGEQKTEEGRRKNRRTKDVKDDSEG